jgi:hypothetical protein
LLKGDRNIELHREGEAKRWLSFRDGHVQILVGSTRTVATEVRNSTRRGEPLIFTVTVVRTASPDGGAAAGRIQFTLVGTNVAGRIKFDSYGRAEWNRSGLKFSKHQALASYAPTKGSLFFASPSLEKSPVERRPAKLRDEHDKRSRERRKIWRQSTRFTPR